MSKGKKRNPDAMQVDTQEEMLSLSLDELIKQRKQAQKQEKKVEVQKQVAKQARQDIVDKRRGIVASKPDLRTIIPKSDLKSQKSTRSKQPVKQQGNNKQGNQPAKQSNQQKKPIEKSIVPKPLKPLKPISEINITIINDTVKQHQPYLKLT